MSCLFLFNTLCHVQLFCMSRPVSWVSHMTIIHEQVNEAFIFSPVSSSSAGTNFGRSPPGRSQIGRTAPPHTSTNKITRCTVLIQSNV